jgi:phospholipase/carboxylesterase
MYNINDNGGWSKNPTFGLRRAPGRAFFWVVCAGESFLTSERLYIVPNPTCRDESLIARRFFTAGAAGLLLSGCVTRAQSDGAVRLRARPREAVSQLEPGTHPLGIRQQRDSILYVPKSTEPDRPAPLMLYLHGAGGSEQQGIRRLSSLADELGFLVLSPASKDATWDAIRGSYGPDVQTIDEALTRTFTARRVDARRIGLAGFSDGASYALGLGLSNGDLFASVLAFSPCFVPAGSKKTGEPRVFVSHGTSDTILPIESCSRRLVPELTHEGLKVTYREFDGPHTVPPEILKQAVKWFLSA